MGEASVSAIRENYQRILDLIAEATVRSGRAPGTVHLVTVTKSQPLNVVQAAIAAGATILGENYAEEAISKINTLKETTVEWHMIGHVQSRKAEMVAGHFDMLHALDSVKLAGRLDQFCAINGCIFPVLLEINISGEQSKFGLPGWDEDRWPDLEPIIEKMLEFPRLRLRGLMTMPPFMDDPEQTRTYFQRMIRLQNFLIKCFPRVDWSELSMGTSADFKVAIEEGATFVRIGQAILGPRPAEYSYGN